MQVLYKSTRGKEETVTASMAILKGLSEAVSYTHLDVYKRQNPHSPNIIFT